MKTFQEIHKEFRIAENQFLRSVKERFVFLWVRYDKADKYFQSQGYKDIQSLSKIEQLQKAFQDIQIELEQISNILSNDEMSELIDEYEKKVP